MNMGVKGEALARQYLTEQGLDFVQANYRLRLGEIDLIMFDAQTLVFIEVKYRSSAHYGSPVEQVTVRKQQKIKMVAQAFLQWYPTEVAYVRFDVVGISPKRTGYRFTWVKGAFE